MPWTGKEFAKKHNHKLSGASADKAAKQAAAILEKTGDEGLAIAVANKNAEKSTSSSSSSSSSTSSGSKKKEKP